MTRNSVSVNGCMDYIQSKTMNHSSISSRSLEWPRLDWSQPDSFPCFSTEFIQTEMHHVRTLKILLHVYMYELKLCPVLDEARLERLFYGLESMLKLHQHFLNCLKSRQSACRGDALANMYPVAEFSDILISQVRAAQSGRFQTTCNVYVCHFEIVMLELLGCIITTQTSSF